jgi:hypothetical protein
VVQLPRRVRTPEDRSKETEAGVTRIRRRYKKNLNLKTKLGPGEHEHLREMVIVLKLSRYSNNQIGAIVGLSRGQVGAFLKEPEVAERLAALRVALPQAALNLLHHYSIEAVQAIADVMRSSNDDKLVLQAAGEILDRTGIAKVSKSDVHKVEEYKTTFTDDGIVDKLRELPVEKQEEAAQMMEQLEAFLEKAQTDED